MIPKLELSLSPERLDEGYPEEIATFGKFAINSGELFLTEGFDSYLGGYRKGPLIAGYYVAEWLAWNWWRLRWEPSRSSDDWLFAHQLNSIGHGYQWPNLTIYSDGMRAILTARRSALEAEPFRYAGAPTLIVPAQDYETAVDAFILQMLERVAELGETNLHRLWRDLLAERADTEMTKRRRLEALLGSEPDSGNEFQIEKFVEDARKLGQAAVDEVAAEVGAEGLARNLHAEDFHDLARQFGYEGRSSDSVRLRQSNAKPRHEEMEPWKVGAALAREIREQESLGQVALSDTRLAEMAGTSTHSLSSSGKAGAPFSFAVESGPIRWRTVFRSARKTGRRFDLARMIGDHLLTEIEDRLHPVTNSTTWRQQAQRSFAIEFLAPIESVKDRLNGDFSLERQHDVADQFVVSPMAINSLLKNRGLLEHDDPFEDIYKFVA